MNKNIFLNGLKVLITMGVLLGLATPMVALAEIPDEDPGTPILQNVKPVAQMDTYTMEADTTLSVPAPGVMVNDSDGDGDPITAILVGIPANGSLILRADGSFDYTPEAGFYGDDHFTYKVYDGALNSNPTPVTIQVSGGDNIEPEANGDTYTTPVDTVLVVDVLGGVLANDFDADGDTLTAQLVISPINGILNFHADGSFEYTPNAGYVGDDHFTYRASDGLATSDPAMVSITVSGSGSAPIAVTDTYTTTMNTTLIVPAPGVLTNDTDPNLDPLTAELVGAPIQFGTLTFNSDGSFTYIPALNTVGMVYFTYRAFDGTNYSLPVQVKIDVQSTNHAPVAVADSYLMLMGTTLTVDTAHGVLANDTDADGDPMTADLLGTPLVNGILMFYDDGSFTYTPSAGVFGTINFTYQAADWLDSSSPVLVTITVKESNTAPVAVADAYLTMPDVPLAVTSASGVLVNDSDLENDALEVQLGDLPDHGIVNVNEDGSFLYTPNAGYEGVDSFTYQAFDGLAASVPVVVTIYVTDDNLAPFAVADTYTMSVGGPLWVESPGVLVNDYDLNGTTLIAQLQHGPDHGTLWLNIDGSFEYVPDPGFLGVDTFTYRAYDGDLTSTAVTVTIYVHQMTYLPIMRK